MTHWNQTVNSKVIR